MKNLIVFIFAMVGFWTMAALIHESVHTSLTSGKPTMMCVGAKEAFTTIEYAGPDVGDLGRSEWYPALAEGVFLLSGFFFLFKWLMKRKFPEVVERSAG